MRYVSTMWKSLHESDLRFPILILQSPFTNRSIAARYKAASSRTFVHIKVQPVSDVKFVEMQKHSQAEDGDSYVLYLYTNVRQLLSV